MKRSILLLLLCALLALAVGCSNQDTTDNQEPAGTTADSTAPETGEPAEEASDPAEADDGATEDAAPTVEEQIELVQGLIDAPVDELYAAIGQPSDSAYASSCLGEGEDGELYYDGFTVYTYRDTDGSESVYDVMPASESGS